LTSRCREASQILSDDDDELGFNHWLVVFNFPEDNKPTPEEMIRLYEETCAKGLNIRLWFFIIINTKFKIMERIFFEYVCDFFSVEEAKKKIYACSTTIYTGFQAVMTEEEVEKFDGICFLVPVCYRLGKKK